MMLYDNFEFEAVAEYRCAESATATHCERIIGWHKGDAPPNNVNLIRVFWTIYGHKPEGGVNALMDFDDLEDALKHVFFFETLIEKERRLLWVTS